MERERCHAKVFDYTNPATGKQCTRPASEIRDGRPVCGQHVRLDGVRFVPKPAIVKV